MKQHNTELTSFSCTSCGADLWKLGEFIECNCKQESTKQEWERVVYAREQKKDREQEGEDINGKINKDLDKLYAKPSKEEECNCIGVPHGKGKYACCIHFEGYPARRLGGDTAKVAKELSDRIRKENRKQEQEGECPLPEDMNKPPSGKKIEWPDLSEEKDYYTKEEVDEFFIEVEDGERDCHDMAYKEEKEFRKALLDFIENDVELGRGEVSLIRLEKLRTKYAND